MFRELKVNTLYNTLRKEYKNYKKQINNNCCCQNYYNKLIVKEHNSSEKYGI